MCRSLSQTVDCRRQISTSETSSLGAKPLYMERLLRIVKSKLFAGEVDIMMKFTLSALWNLTGMDHAATTGSRRGSFFGSVVRIVISRRCCGRMQTSAVLCGVVEVLDTDVRFESAF